MAIDWITVSAQIVNFLLLVWLLKRFLYQPVMRAMERRERRIADGLEDAEMRERSADEKAHDHQQKIDELAEHEKRHMLDEARDEAAEARKNWQRQTTQEKEEFLNNLQKRAADTIQVIAKKTLADLANAELEEQMVHSFIRQLKSLDDEEFRMALRQSSTPVSVVSAFELPTSTRARLTRAIHEHLVEGIEVEYDRSPDLLCGIELNAEGRRLGWNLDDYLDQLSGRVEEVLSPARAMG